MSKFRQNLVFLRFVLLKRDEPGVQHLLELLQPLHPASLLPLLPQIYDLRPTLQDIKVTETILTNLRETLSVEQIEAATERSKGMELDATVAELLTKQQPPHPLLSRQRLEQRFGLLQVGRIEPLAEPAIDLSQPLAGLPSLSLPLP